MALVVASPNSPTIVGQQWSATYNGANPHTIVVDLRLNKLILYQEQTISGRTLTVELLNVQWELGDPNTATNRPIIVSLIETFWHARTGVAPT